MAPRTALMVALFAMPACTSFLREEEEPRRSQCTPSVKKRKSLRPSYDYRSFETNGSATTWSGLKFFLHEHGAYNFTDRVNCYRKALGIGEALAGMDTVALPNAAEHATDLWSLMQLRRHPGRVLDMRAADLHIIGAAFGASFHASNLTGEPCGDRDEHHRRVAAVLREMQKSAFFTGGKRRNWMLIDTDWSWHKILTPEFLHVFQSSHMLLATADRNISKLGNVAPEDTIVMPYVAHRVLDRAFDMLRPGQRQFSFTFHGTMDRHGSGHRRAILRNLTAHLEAASVEEHSFSGQTASQFATVTGRTANIMKNSVFCLVPAGDTASSRRLFDALAAGCVPIIFHTFESIAVNLPFASFIDWNKLAFFAGSLKCAEYNVESVTEWLKELWSDRHEHYVRRKQKAGQKAFRKVLSYRMGNTVSAMLGEVGLVRLAAGK